MSLPENPEVAHCPLPTDDDTSQGKEAEDAVNGPAPMPPIIRAISRGNEFEFQRIVENQPDMPNRMGHVSSPPLQVAAFERNLRDLAFLLEEGAEVNKPNAQGFTALHVAVMKEWHQGVETLLRHGADANAKPCASSNFEGMHSKTPLQDAVRRGNVTLVQLLLLQGNADLSLTNSNHSTVIHLAALARNTTLLRMLLAKKECEGLLHKEDDSNNSALHSVLLGDDNGEEDIDEKAVDCLNLLLDQGMEINSLNVKGESPLLLAARHKMPLALELLLRCGAKATVEATDGTTVLHAASASGCSNCLRKLLQLPRTKNLVRKEDIKGKTPFELAVKSCSLECCQLLLRNGDHLGRRDKDGVSMCSLALRNLPGSQDFLEKVFDENLSASGEDPFDPDFSVTFDYSPLLYVSKNVQTSVLPELTSSKTEELLKHPLLESFLFLKWRRIAPVFYFNTFVYFIFLVLHSAYIILTFGEPQMSWKEKSSHLMSIRILFSVIFFLIAIPSIFHALINWRRTFKEWETLCKLVILFTTFYIVFCLNVLSDSKMVVETHMASISSLFAWIELMVLLGRFPSVGVYILMFSHVAKSLLTFLMAFLPLLIGFTVAFHVLMKNIAPFSGVFMSFSKTSMMMIGEVDFKDIMEGVNADYKVIVKIALIVFLFLVSILMANLLIGLAVNDIPELQRQGRIHRLRKEASYLASTELLLQVFNWIPSSVRRKIARNYKVPSTVTIEPNKKTSHHLRKSKNYIPSGALKRATQICMSASASSKNKDTPVTQLLRRIDSKRTRDRHVLEEKIGSLQESCRNHSCSDVAKELRTLKEQLLNQTNVLNQILSARTYGRVYPPFSGLGGSPGRTEPSAGDGDKPTQERPSP
ncbi:transient receptor potential cation channel subfamily A member 1 homolog isoform X1 [Oratosquilla oratoria]|uniref:transient receptor potential cation channel subfamily A member 1 homolog isoform X1 n=1 Tax=Oratosquilla oratoria TaxID=337810 RepID=UPI003F767B56